VDGRQNVGERYDDAPYEQVTNPQEDPKSGFPRIGKRFKADKFSNTYPMPEPHSERQTLPLTYDRPVLTKLVGISAIVQLAKGLALLAFAFVNREFFFIQFLIACLVILFSVGLTKVRLQHSAGTRLKLILLISGFWNAILAFGYPHHGVMLLYNGVDLFLAIISFRSLELCNPGIESKEITPAPNRAANE